MGPRGREEWSQGEWSSPSWQLWDCLLHPGLEWELSLKASLHCRKCWMFQCIITSFIQNFPNQTKSVFFRSWFYSLPAGTKTFKGTGQGGLTPLPQGLGSGGRLEAWGFKYHNSSVVISYDICISLSNLLHLVRPLLLQMALFHSFFMDEYLLLCICTTSLSTPLLMDI